MVITRLMVLMGKFAHSLSSGASIDIFHSGYYTAPTGTGASNPYGYQTNNTSTNY